MSAVSGPRIVQVCAVDFTAYHLLRPLLHGLRDDGWTTEVACADGQLAQKLRDEGFLHHNVPMTRAPSPARLALAVWDLARTLARDRPNIVHTHTPVGGIVGRTAAILAGGSKIAHTFHGLPLAGGPPSPVERAFLTAERLVARRTDLFLSQAANDVQRAVTLGIAPADTVVIGNGVDVHRFAPNTLTRRRMRASLGIPSDATVVLFVGRLVREKGLLELADAALALRDAPTVHVLVAGAALASDRTDVSRLLDVHPVIDALGIRWRRLGYREDVADLLQAADVFVLPSYREGLPRSVIEAMASGLPVVASDIPASRELVSEDTGILVPSRDSSTLADAIWTLTTDEARRMRMGARSRQIALEKHDERLIVQRQVRLLRSLVSTP